ncbi:hypothetical protein DVH05_010816 [Phytophthora capsici]|nr:hypothetical protein DVH05_010816 [Phytophthora capsici]
MEEELRVLRLELKAARSDAKRYASYALRLQQELAQERQKHIDDNGFKEYGEKYVESVDVSEWDTKVEKSVKKTDAWRRKINGIVNMMDEKVLDSQEEDSKGGNQVEERPERTLKMLGPFLLQLKNFIGELGRDNAKLRDMLRTRPTRRELVSSQLEVDRLQREVHNLHTRVRSSGAKRKELQPVGDADERVVKEPSLTERILEERLLQMLRVNTESSAMHHKYLNEKLHCYLSFDPSRLAERQGFTEISVLERVGRLCSDIVASCCYVLEVEEVGELPDCVQRSHQLARVSTIYQEFVERIEKLLKRFDKDAFYSIRAESTAKTSCHDALEMILAHVNDVLVELDARREQMKPPGSKAHEVLLANMKLLQVAHVDQLTPTIRRLVDNMRAEQEFQHGLCELFGLDESASRKQILHVASVLFGELGFLTNNGL